MLVTNTDFEPSETMKTYKNLKEIEDAFRDMKSFLKLRPIYHWKDRRVNAHVFVCVQSFLTKCLINRYKKDFGISAKAVIRELIKIKISKIPIDCEDVLVVDKLGKKQKHILKVLELDEPTPLQM